eukprot:507234-Pyramimonas_sp.AAC.1
MKPGHGSGAYKRYMRTVLPSAGPCDNINIPAHVRGHPEKRYHTLPIRLAYDSLSDEVSNGPAMLQMLLDDIDNPNSVLGSRAYHSNAIMQTIIEETGVQPKPLALYLDGVRYTAPGAGKQDSIWEISPITMLSNTRHL